MKAYYERVQDEIDGICPTKGKLSTNKVEKKMKNELKKRFEEFYKDIEDVTVTLDLELQANDDILAGFMKEKFGEEWEDNEEAFDFYKKEGCDVRAEYDDIARAPWARRKTA